MTLLCYVWLSVCFTGVFSLLDIVNLLLSEKAKNPEYNVEYPAAEDGGGATEARGQHQENLRFPGCRGHQG